jgi:hypothetical protein
MALILDLVPMQDLIGYVRGIQLEEDRNRFQLQAYLPNINIDEIEWRVTTGQLNLPDAAMVRSWDTEAPIGGRQGLTRLMGELPPISQKMRLGEEERLRKRKLENSAFTGLVDAVYNDAHTLTRAVLSRIEMLRGEVLEFGTITINENGVAGPVIDFGRSGAHSVTAATKWDAAGNIISDLRTWVQVYIDTNGVAPAAILTSSAVVGAMLLNQSIRDLLNTGLGSPALVTVDSVQAILAAFGLPPIITYDTKVRVSGSLTNVINPKKIILLPPADEPLGNTFFGTTAESLVLQEARVLDGADAPGMVATLHPEDDPVSTWTKVACIALPTLPNPNLTLTGLVLT